MKMNLNETINNKWVRFTLIICMIVISFLLGLFLGNKNVIDDNQTFYATIEKINGNNLLVNGIDANDINFRSKFSFNIKDDTILTWRYTNINQSDLGVGDRIAITFNGPVLDSYPAQLTNVIKVQLLSDKFNE